jgi:mono/diheme cytochrome c family protein
MSELSGSIDGRRRPLLRVPVLRRDDVLAVIDTGFTGELLVDDDVARDGPAASLRSAKSRGDGCRLALSLHRIVHCSLTALSLLVACHIATRADVPPPPEDPPAAKAYAVFDRHCAACHQAGKLRTLAPAGSLGDILDLAALARTPALVRPGHPDGSPLYQLMQARLPPHDTPSATPETGLAAEDIDAVRDWIQRLPAVASCPTAPRITRADVAAAVAARRALAGPRGSDLRVLSLSNAIGTCATPAEVAARRHAVTLTLNSLSWAPKPVVPDVFGPSDSLLAIDLTALGWTAERWARIARLDPYAGRLIDDAEHIVRADWFVATAWQQPMYADLLGLPDHVATLTRALGIDVAQDLASNRAHRAALKTSALTRNNRLVQRHPSVFGAFWTTSEYASAPGRPDLIDRPSAVGTPDASFGLFSLPNGFTAFFLANGEGAALTDVPASVARNDLAPSRRLAAGAACLACHASGPRPLTDELRARAEAEPGFADRDRVLALHRPAAVLAGLIADDRTRLANAHRAAGLPPDPSFAGLPVVPAVIARYGRAVTLEQAAVELDVPEAALRDAARRDIPGLTGDVLRRLRHGPVPRRLIEAAAPGLVAAATGAPLPEIKPVQEPFTLVLTAEETRFKVGDTFSVTARATEACNLTLIAVDRNGRGTIIWPNDFEPDNRLVAGKEVIVPPPDGPYQFRFDAPGRETMIGICLATSKTPSGIRHDFERQRFTELGDYRGFLNRTLANEPAARAEAQKAEQQARGARRAIRRTDIPAPPVPPGEAQARASIQLEVVP